MTTPHDEIAAALRGLAASPHDLRHVETLASHYLRAPDDARAAQHVVEAELAPRLGFIQPPAATHFRHNLVMAPPWRVCRPASLTALHAEMARAVVERRPMRALGDAWGFCNIAETSGLVIDLGAMRSELPLDAAQLAPGVDAASLLHFEAGATIQDLSLKLAGRGRALINQPGFEGLTFVGTMSAGGHGSGVFLGPLSAQVRALRLCTVDAQERLRTLHIEPRAGAISRSDARWPGVDELVFDDALFHACTVAMGTLGVITSAVIETRPFFCLREQRTLWRWSELRGRLDAIVRDPTLHSVHLWVNPYLVDGERHVVLSRYDFDAGPPHGARPFSYALGGAQVLADLIVFVVRHFPDALPGLMLASLKATVDHDVVLPCYDALNFGPPNHLRVLAASSGVAAEHAVDVVDALGALAAQRFRDGGLMTSPVGLRWVRASRALMSPQYGRDTCMVEVPLLDGTPGAEATLRAYLDMMFERFGARPHWGQFNPMSVDRLRALYPELKRFLAAFQTLNPGGSWDNTFTQQTGLRALAPL